MDKYEYRIKAEQIVKLVGRRDYATAMKIADGIDWNRVKNVQMLCTVSEVYEKNQKYEEGRDILLLAYDRSPIGRMIVYRLVELSILLEDFDEAIAYYKEYEQIAPTDTNIYVLKYKIYKGRGATVETLISILEEFKRKDYHEEWALELARLYHEGGYAEKCVEECDEIDLWFNNGPSVIEALELKMCYHPLTHSQKEKYEHRNDVKEEAEVEDLEMLLQKSEQDGEPLVEEPKEELMDQAIAKKEPVAQELVNQELVNPEPVNPQTVDLRFVDRKPVVVEPDDFDIEPESQITKEKTKEIPIVRREKINLGEPEEEIVVTPLIEFESNKYDTINLQKELARSIQKLLDATEKETVDVTLQNVKKMVEDSHIPELTETMRFRTVRSEMLSNAAKQRAKELEYLPEIEGAVPHADQQDWENLNLNDEVREIADTQKNWQAEDRTMLNPEPSLRLKPTKEEKKRKMEQILTQESDGQIGLVVPDELVVEKQITGQMNIEDILREQEKQKLLSENDREKLALEEARKRALEETQEIMNEIMNLLRDVIPKIGSLRDGEERMAVLASSLEKVQNSLPVFSKDILQDAEVMRQELDSVNVSLAEAAGNVLGEVAEDMEEDDDAADVIEDKIGSSIPTEISALVDDSVNGYDMRQDLFAQENEEEPEDTEEMEEPEEAVEEGEEPTQEEADSEMEFTNAEEEVDQELIEKAFVEMQRSIQEDTEDDNVKEIKLDFEEEQKALQELFADGSGLSAKEECSQEAVEEIAVDDEYENIISDDEFRLNEEQRGIFAYFLSIHGIEEKLKEVLKRNDQSTENMIITGVAGSGKTSLAMRIVKAMQVDKEEKIDTIAKIKGASLNQKDIEAIFEKVAGGVLIIEKAGTLTETTMIKLEKMMEEYQDSVQVFLADKEAYINKLRKNCKSFMDKFTVQIDLPVYTNAELVEFGKAYAKVKGYDIDNVAVLALYSQIGVLQTDRQTATLNDVKEIIDEAVQRAEKRCKKLFGKLFSRSKQTQGILLESDFAEVRKS